MLEGLPLHLVHASLSIDRCWFATVEGGDSCLLREEYFETIAKLKSEFPETWHLLLLAEEVHGGRLPSQGSRRESFADELRLRSIAAMGGRFHICWQEQGFLRFLEGASDEAGSYLHCEKTKAHGDAEGRDNSYVRCCIAGLVKCHRRVEGLPFKQEEEEDIKERKSGGSRSTETSQDLRGQMGESRCSSKDVGEHFVSTDDGTAICFRYAKGKGGECGEPCKEGR